MNDRLCTLWILLQIEYASDIDEADHMAARHYQLYNRCSGTTYSPSESFADATKYFEIMAHICGRKNLDIRIFQDNQVVLDAMIDNPRIYRKERLKNTFFRFDPGCCSSVSLSEKAREKVRKELCTLFSLTKFKADIHPVLGMQTFTCGATSLSFQPAFLFGPCNPLLVKQIECVLAYGRSFSHVATDICEEIYNITPEQEAAYYRQYLRTDVRNRLLKAFTTGSKPIPVDNLLDDLAHHITLPTPRITTGYLPTDPPNRFVREVYAQLLSEGLIAETED